MSSGDPWDAWPSSGPDGETDEGAEDALVSTDVSMN
jgi:hypothetical protein